jgi:hypothetical protein
MGWLKLGAVGPNFFTPKDATASEQEPKCYAHTLNNFSYGVPGHEARLAAHAERVAQELPLAEAEEKRAMYEEAMARYKKMRVLGFEPRKPRFKGYSY